MLDFLLENSNHKKPLHTKLLNYTHLQNTCATIPYRENPCWLLVWCHGQAGVDQLSAFLTRCLSRQLVLTKMLLGYRRLEWRQDTKFSWRQYLERECIYITVLRRRFISMLVHTQKNKILQTSLAGCIVFEERLCQVNYFWISSLVVAGRSAQDVPNGENYSWLLFFFSFDVYRFKVLIEFDTILLVFHVLVSWPWGMWDLS